jgi:hypothetical protein
MQSFYEAKDPFPLYQLLHRLLHVGAYKEQEEKGNSLQITVFFPFPDCFCMVSIFCFVYILLLSLTTRFGSLHMI